MATRRRGADLSDLKNRLGLPETNEADAATPAAEPSKEGAAGDSAAPAPAKEGGASAAAPRPAAAPAKPAPAPAKPSVGADGVEDYSSSVSEVETDEPIRFDVPDDPGATSGGSSMRLGLVILVVAASMIALVLGYIGGSVFDGRRVVNSQIAEANLVRDSVEQVGTQLMALQRDVSDMRLDSGFSEELQTALSATYGESRPVVRPQLLVSARTLLAYNENLSRELIAFSYETQILGGLVDQHLRLTRRDAEEIQREIAGAEDTRNHGIIFDFRSQYESYRSFIQSEGETPYGPGRGIAVTYDSLDIIQDDGGDFYEVTFRDGQERRIPATDLVTVARESLIEGVTSETALGRWRARAMDLQERLESAVESHNNLRPRIDALADRPTLFAL